jgi:hypothetical protein
LRSQSAGNRPNISLSDTTGRHHRRVRDQLERAVTEGAEAPVVDGQFQWNARRSKNPREVRAGTSGSTNPVLTAEWKNG